MCKKAKISKLSEQVLSRITKVTESDIEKFVAIKILQKELDKFLEDSEFQESVNTQYEKAVAVAEETDEAIIIIECPTKKVSPRASWVYSKSLLCDMEDIKSKQKKEQISGKAKATLSKVKYVFSATVK